MHKKPKAPKTVSLKKVAKNYMKSTKPSSDVRDAKSGNKFTVDGRIPTVSAPRTVAFKPKAKSVTLGGSRSGNPATIRKKGRS